MGTFLAQTRGRRHNPVVPKPSPPIHLWFLYYYHRQLIAEKPYVVAFTPLTNKHPYALLLSPQKGVDVLTVVNKGKNGIQEGLEETSISILLLEQGFFTVVMLWMAEGAFTKVYRVLTFEEEVFEWRRENWVF